MVLCLYTATIQRRIQMFRKLMIAFLLALGLGACATNPVSNYQEANRDNVPTRTGYYIDKGNFSVDCFPTTTKVQNIDLFTTEQSCLESPEFKATKQVLDKELENEIDLKISKRVKFLKDNPKYNKYAKQIKLGYVSIGMPEELLVVIKGEPTSINITETKNVRFIQRVYKYSGYVYTTNGVVTAIQNK